MDIELDSDNIRLVVEGNITDIEGNQYVRLTETANYFSNTQPTPVEDADLTVNNGEESFSLFESENEKGLYLFPENFIGHQGITYQLNINLKKEIGGFSEYSAQSTMPLLSDDIDSVAVKWEPDFEGWFVNLYAQDPPREDFYMFNALVNGKLVTDSIHKVNISDDRLFNGNYTYGTTVLFFSEEELNPGDTFTLISSNITKEYADFINEVKTEISPSNPLFSGPPVNVSSNISNSAAGWFSSFPSAFTSTIVKDFPIEK